MAGVHGLFVQRHQRVHGEGEGGGGGGGDGFSLHVPGLVVLDGGVVHLAQVLSDARVLPSEHQKKLRGKKGWSEKVFFYFVKFRYFDKISGNFVLQQ